ncbi:MAG: D-alanine--D-alanine ligase [Coriobacteriales bacterium]
MITTKPCEPAVTKVVLLKGGKSGEREISLKSGAACADALRDEGFEVVEIDLAADDALQQIVAAQPTVVFLALHGKYGEDGCVQGLCELLELPYTGSGVLASALAMDKERAKVMYQAAGLKTAPWIVVHPEDKRDAASIIEELGEKVVVKAVHQGSSLGVFIVEGATELEMAITDAFAFDDTVIVEKYIQGTETTVAVLGNDETEALPVIEIVPQGDSTTYDFTAKYAAGGSKHIIPARLDDRVTAACQEMALRAHKALGCRGVSRTDIFVDEEGECWAIETNTLPGMTSTSLLPDTAGTVGISFGALCRMLVELALEEHA